MEESLYNHGTPEKKGNIANDLHIPSWMQTSPQKVLPALSSIRQSFPSKKRAPIKIEVQWVHGEKVALRQQTMLAIEQAISQQARVPSSNSHGTLSFDTGRWSGTKQDLAKREFLTRCPSPFSSTSSSSTSSTSGPQPVKTGGWRFKVGEASRTFAEFGPDLAYLSPGAMPEPVGAFHRPTTVTDDEELRQWLEKRKRQMAEIKHKEN